MATLAREIAGVSYAAYRVLACLDESPDGATPLEIAVVLHGDHRRAGASAVCLATLADRGLARFELVRFGRGPAVAVWHSTAAGAAAVARFRKAVTS